MSTQKRSVLKNWFRKGLKPTEQQFADAFDSFFHKNEDMIPLSNVQGLTAAIESKKNELQEYLNLVLRKTVEDLTTKLNDTLELQSQLDVRGAFLFDGICTDQIDINDSIGINAGATIPKIYFSTIKKRFYACVGTYNYYTWTCDDGFNSNFYDLQGTIPRNLYISRDGRCVVVDGELILIDDKISNNGSAFKKVCLTLEEYKALPETDPNIMYLIINEDEDDEGR